jgi:predicted nuclease of predicted toxin-antitoxin system
VTKVLVDVNLSPTWAERLATEGIEAVHWSAVGDPRAPDDELLRYAREHGYVVFTHDLDFGALLARTRAHGPSVIQVRAQNVLPDAIGDLVVRVVTEQAAALESGALVTVEPYAARVRVLPIV